MQTISLASPEPGVRVLHVHPVLDFAVCSTPGLSVTELSETRAVQTGVCANTTAAMSESMPQALRHPSRRRN